MTVLSSLYLLIFIASFANGQYCPKFCRCEKDNQELWCSIDSESDLIDIPLDALQSLHIGNWPSRHFNFGSLENATKLREISISHSKYLKSIVLPKTGSKILDTLVTLSLNDNQISDSGILQELTDFLPQLQNLNLSHNAIAWTNSSKDDPITSSLDRSELRVLDLSRNEIEVIPSTLPSRLRTLDLSWNGIKELNYTSEPNFQLESLSLRGNGLSEITQATMSRFPNLKSLDVSQNPLSDSFPSEKLFHRSLNELKVQDTNLRWINFTALTGLQQLHELDASKNQRLLVVTGKVSDLQSIIRLNLFRSRIRTFPKTFFSGILSDVEIDISENPIACNNCLLQWSQNIAKQADFGNFSAINCFEPASRIGSPLEKWSVNGTCDLDVGMEDNSMVKGANREELILHCDAVGSPDPKVTWERLTPIQQTIGWWDPDTQEIHIEETLKAVFDILPGGDLIVRDLNLDLKGDFKCIAESSGQNASAVVSLRVDFSSFTIHVKVFSVFCGIATALGFFLLNVLWASLRSFILWRISLSEKKGRVRRMLEGMEKYRQRQVETLHEKYTHRLNLIRDNYNTQAEQLHKSYASQAGKFRDYKAQQMEHVSQQIDSLRDNYGVQIGRVRDYGSRQMERLWENYQRQMNRIRTFSLQQRLRMMHTYKIKQRYLNSLLESMNANAGHEASSPHHEMMTMPSLTEDGRDLYAIPVVSFGPDADTVSVSTYHSLPPDGDDDGAEENDESSIPSTSKREFV